VAWEKFKYDNRESGSDEESWSTPEVRQWASEKVDEGYNWHEINELGKEEGIFTFGGSDLDDQLWREFEGQENPLYDGGSEDNWEENLTEEDW